MSSNQNEDTQRQLVPREQRKQAKKQNKTASQLKRKKLVKGQAK